MKRLIRILLCLLLAAGLFSTAAMAADPDATIDDYTYRMYTYGENGDLEPEAQTHPMASLPTYAGTSHFLKIYYRGTEITSDISSETPLTLTLEYNAEQEVWIFHLIGEAGAQIGVSFPVPGEDTRVLHPYWLQALPGDGSSEPAQALVFRFTNWEDGRPYEDETQGYSCFSWMGPFVGNSMQGYFYYYDGTSYLPVTNISLSGTAAKVSSDTDQDNKQFWRIEYIDEGNITLTFTYGDSQTATENLSLTLPATGLYAAQTRSVANYLFNLEWLNLDSKTIWLLSENGFTDADADAVTVTAGDSTLPVTKTLRTGTQDRYDLSFELPRPAQYGYDLCAMLGDRHLAQNWVSEGHIEGSCLVVDGYTVGFSFLEGPDVVLINEGNWSYGNTTYFAKDETMPYNQWREASISAGIHREDSEGNVYHELADHDKVQITVNKMWIEEYDGDAGVFAFDSAGSQTVTSDFQSFYLNTPAGAEKPYYGTGRYFFVKDSYVGQALAWAEVTVTVDDGAPVTGNVSVALFIDRSVSTDYEHQPDEDMTAERRMNDLNTLLQTMAAQIDPNAENQSFSLQLASGEYEGTMVIPSGFYGEKAELSICGSQDGTTILGGIDLNGSRIGSIRDLHFKSQDTNAEDKAVYNGYCIGTMNCSFVGYDVALDSTGAGNINPSSENFFLNNEVAVRMDVKDLYRDMSRNSWELNTFINNTTAIQLVTLNDFLSPYYIRCTDSNFINNGTDFDASCGGTIYMYRNYYGEYAEKFRPAYGKAGKDDKNLLKLDELLGSKTESALKTNHVESCPAKVKTAASTGGVKTMVITNPRWKHPVKNWWHHSSSPNQLIWGTTQLQMLSLAAEEPEEPEYPDILVVDWAQDTHILNTEAASLRIDASAFEETGEKEIQVVDSSDNKLGTWLFDPADEQALLLLADVAAASGSFYAGLEIDRSTPGQISVKVTDSNVLRTKAPLLLLPFDAAAASVTLDGVSIPCQVTDGNICFSVAAGGTYVITLQSAATMDILSDIDLDNGSVTVGLHSAIGTEQVAAAFYDSNGKMIGIGLLTPDPAADSITISVDLSDDSDAAASVQVFLLDQNALPLDAMLQSPTT